MLIAQTFAKEIGDELCRNVFESQGGIQVSRDLDRGEPLNE